MRAYTEPNVDTAEEVYQMRCRESIDRHMKARERVRAKEKELFDAETELLKATEQMQLLGVDYER